MGSSFFDKKRKKDKYVNVFEEVKMAYGTKQEIISGIVVNSLWEKEEKWV